MMNGARNEPCCLLVSDHRYGKQILKKYRPEDVQNFRTLSYRDLEWNQTHVNMTDIPMVIDNSFLLSFAEDVGHTIRNLEHGKLADFREISELKEKLEQSKDWKILAEYKRLTHFQERQLFNALKKEIDLKIKLGISKEQTRQSPYFYVPLTLFLFFYFIMFIYIISNFIF